MHSSRRYKRSEKACVRALLRSVYQSQQHGFVPLNKAGEVQAPVKLWCDTSTGAECQAIMDAFGGFDACIKEVGNPILPGYTASKVRWFRNAHPGLYAQMDTILLPHDYLNFYLTGERCMEAGDASGTGFLNITTRTWSEKMLAAIDPDRDLTTCLPEAKLTNESIGELLPSVAREVGLPPGVPVSIGGGDNMMGAVGYWKCHSRRCHHESWNIWHRFTPVRTSQSSTKKAILRPSARQLATGYRYCALVNCTVTTELMRNLLKADHGELRGATQYLKPWG